jgi:Ca2+-binding EF-hand superfamily protein
MRRLDHAFDAMDSDADGYIVPSDVQDLASRFPIAKDDPQARSIQSFYEMYWQELVRQSGCEGEFMNKEVFFIGHTRRAFNVSQEAALQDSADSIFQCMAGHGSNEVTKDTFVIFLDRVWYIRRQDAEGAFHELDTDEDGRVTRQEFLESARQYLYSTKYNPVGAVFFSEI